MWFHHEHSESTIVASNNDFLLKFNFIAKELDYVIDSDNQISHYYENDNDDKANKKERTWKEMQFISLREVQVLENKFELELGPNKIEMKPLHSLVSPGIEIKVIRGNF